MTAKEAAAKGYRLIQASAFEVGLIYRERGVRTWWAGTFGCRMPDFSDPVIMDAVERHEQHLRETCPECGRMTGNCYVCSSCLKVSVL